MPSPDILTVLASGLAALVLCLYLVSRRRGPYPPGPKPLPLIGNLLEIPFSHEYKTYAQWGKDHGDVVHVSVLGKHIVVLNSVDAAKDLLDGRSATYSDRPFIPMLHDLRLMDANWSFGFKQYAPAWRRQRQLFAQHLNPAASRAFFDTQKASAHLLLRSLLCESEQLRAPERLAVHLRHATAQTILSIAYGYQMQGIDDPIVALAEHIIKTVGEGVLPGRYLVNVFPWLKYVPAWFPGAGFQTCAAKAREASQRLIDTPFDEAKRRIAEGIAKPSFVTNALMDSDHSPDHGLMVDISEVAAAMYGGAADTTVSSMHSCLLALVLNPPIQARAHAELDTVLGLPTSPTFRLPTFADREDLPYIDAIVKESLRWFPAVPIGLPHATTEDDVYRGWTIPKGTIVIANSWLMLRDEKTYADPLVFRPERFLGENPDPHPDTRGCFGFGRRECPGRHLAEASLWIQIASLLAAFTLSPAKDKDGREIDVSYARDPPAGLTLHPQHFTCVITPRSKEAEMRINETQTEGEW